MSDIFTIRNGELIAYGGNDISVVIPDGVTTIGAGAFEWNNELTEVYIPDSVTCIMDRAFCGCRNLKKVRLPQYLTGVKECAFEYTPWIDAGEPIDIRVPEGTEEIASHAFDGFSYWSRYQLVLRELGLGSLLDSRVPRRETFSVKGPVIQSLVLPSSIKSVNGRGFAGLEITLLQLSEGLEQIGERAFSCDKLKEVRLPDSLKELHKDAFHGCDKNLVILCGDGVYSAVDRTFRDNAAIKWLRGKLECTLSQEKPMIKYVNRMRNNFVKQIKGDDAAMMARILSCGKAKQEQIEAYIEMMNDGKHPQVLAVLMDYQQKNFKQGQIEHAADLKAGFDERTVKEWEKIFRLKKDEAGYVIAKFKGIDKNPEIPMEIEGTQVYAIGNNCFKGNDTIEEIEIPGSIQTIGDGAFENCVHLKTVRFSKGLKHIGKRAFYGCTGLEGEMFLPEGLLTNGLNAFSFGYAKDFRALHLPESMKEFKGWYGEDSSTDLYIHGKKTKYNSETLMQVRDLYVHRDSAWGKYELEYRAKGESPAWPVKIIGIDDVPADAQ